MQDVFPGGPGRGPALPGFGPVGHALLKTSRAIALAGGGVFVALVAMSVASIVGRKLAAAPVPGDVEVLQMGAAFACASFFAYCHLIGGDVKVDFFTARLSEAAVHALDACGSFLYALVGIALASRTLAGALTVRASGESSVILGWPVWVAQFLMVPGFALMALAGLYMVGVHLRLSASHAAGKRA
jgi:TRAP-type mannitol/chloroaromatic compound transport system permease small subunit